MEKSFSDVDLMTWSRCFDLVAYVSFSLVAFMVCPEVLGIRPWRIAYTYLWYDLAHGMLAYAHARIVVYSTHRPPRLCVFLLFLVRSVTVYLTYDTLRM